MNKQRRKNSGSALFFGLMIVVVMAILSSVFLSMVLTEMKNTERSNSAANAMSVAEAGIEFAIWEILHGGSDYSASDGWSSTSLPTTNNAILRDNLNNPVGEYRVTVDNPLGTLVVESIAAVPDFTNPSSDSQTVKVILDSEPLFDKGITGLGEVKMAEGALVDSYDYTLGPYGGANIGSNGDIATLSTGNNDIVIANNAVVDGDVYVGIGGTPANIIQYAGTGMITGLEKILTTTPYNPSVLAPTGLTDMGTLNLGAGDVITLSDSGEYDNINVSHGGVLVIDSDATIYVKNDFTITHGSTLQITNNADVDVFVGDEFEVLHASAIDNVGGDTINFAVYGLPSARTIDLTGGSDVQGTFYAPDSMIKIGVGVSIYGAVTAQKINLGNGSAIHFDESLLTREGAPVNGKVQVFSWQTK